MLELGWGLAGNEKCGGGWWLKWRCLHQYELDQHVDIEEANFDDVVVLMNTRPRLSLLAASDVSYV